MSVQARSQAFLKSYKQTCKEQQLRFIQNISFDGSIQYIVDKTLSQCSSAHLSPKKNRVLKNSHEINRTPSVVSPVVPLRSASKIRPVSHKRNQTSICVDPVPLLGSENQKRTVKADTKTLQSIVSSFNKQAERLKNCMNTKTSRQNSKGKESFRSRDGSKVELKSVSLARICCETQTTFDLNKSNDKEDLNTIIKDYECAFSRIKAKYYKIKRDKAGLEEKYKEQEKKVANLQMENKAIKKENLCLKQQIECIVQKVKEFEVKAMAKQSCDIVLFPEVIARLEKENECLRKLLEINISEQTRGGFEELKSPDMSELIKEYKKIVSCRNSLPSSKKESERRNVPKAPKNLTEVRNTAEKRLLEDLITPIKDEGKHQLPYEKGVKNRINAKELREKMRLDFSSSSLNKGSIETCNK